MNIPHYTLVSTHDAAVSAINSCKKRGLTALDFETTSLRPADGRVRLVSLCNGVDKFLLDFDSAGPFRLLADYFMGGQWIVFNAGFEGRWFLDAGGYPTLLDVGYLRRAIMGGGQYSLKMLIKWDLKIEMSKEQQRSDWSLPTLSQEQLDYAYLDADLTWKLWQHWYEKADTGHMDGLMLLNDMVPAVIEMEESGMLLDRVAHSKLVRRWAITKAEKFKRLREFVSDSEVANINSGTQWSDYFARSFPDNFLAGWPRTEKTGTLSTTTATLNKLAGFVSGTPLEEFFDTLAGYKKISKYLSSFGTTLIDSSDKLGDGRVHARFNIGAAKTCRFSSSGPNLQQVPRDNEILGEATSVRSSFIAGRGKRLVSLDYSGIELRVLALLAGDDQLLQDMVEGDVHSEVASVIAGHKIDKTTKEGKAARTAAKAVSFGIIYGSGAAGLAATMRTTVSKAEEYIHFWENRYNKAFNYRFTMQAEARATKFIRCVDGGTIYMGREPDLPKLANYPVQRAALSIMAKAISYHKTSLDKVRAEGKHEGTRLLATIHDALIDEAFTEDSKDCLRIMTKDMVAGYKYVFPGAPTERLVEGGIGKSWATLE